MREMTLEERHRESLLILKDVHDFCLSHGITYSLAYGTLLGAIRHKGYIPWDDDIDIALLRPDYEKFVKTYTSKDGQYHLYDFRKDPDYHYPYAKIADTRTILDENVSMKNIGVNIDVFPFDYMFDTREECTRFIGTLDRLKKLFRIKLVKPGKKNVWWKRILIRLAKIVMAPVSIRKIVEKEYEKASVLTNDKAKYVAFALDPRLEGAYRSVYPRCMFENFLKVPFDNEEFMVTAEYDKWLTQMYGDYMTPPPDGKKTSPHTLSDIYWI